MHVTPTCRPLESNGHNVPLYLIKSYMKDTILEFTLNGRKHTYYRRNTFLGEALTTTNIHSAKKLNKANILEIIKLLKKQFGDNITDIKSIKMDEK